MSARRFEDRFVRSFPADPSRLNQPRQVFGAAYSRVDPTPVAGPELIAWSDAAAASVALERPQADDPWVEILAGNRVEEDMQVYASCYGGHQFGAWAGQLGDGRALGLGEREGIELQLKGAGPTPYSRHADGRAVLRSSIREFLCSEIMERLGVPTTRALSLVLTGDPVVRDMFYDGNPQAEPGAICCRLSPSFIRFGHFEIFAHRGEHELLESLIEFVIRHYYSGLTRAEWYAEVCRRTAELMVHWLRVGFVHGVMNTDNMSILGLTIDYGPYGWLDPYEPGFTPNTTDRMGRYAYGRQGSIGLWNVERLAGALAVVMSVEDLEKGLQLYVDTFERGYRLMLAAKLGLDEAPPELLRDLMTLLTTVEVDMTRFFRALSEDPARLDRALYAPPTVAYRERLKQWLTDYAAACALDPLDPEKRRARMRAVNPRIIPRNFLVQGVIDAAEGGDYAPIARMLADFADPYADGEETWDRLRPEWARSAPGCSALSCSS